MVDNLMNTLDMRTREQLARKTIQEKVSLSGDGQVSLSGVHGPTLPVHIGSTSTGETPQLSVEDVVNMQLEASLSDR